MYPEHFARTLKHYLKKNKRNANGAADPIAAGFILMFFYKPAFYVNLGKVIFSFGLIFFGLFTMEEAVEPMKNSNYFVMR